MTSPTATILIVDDEIRNRKLLEAMLQHEGYLTLSAANGEEALASIAQHAPDLILLDIVMPDMDGYQVASILKANPATSNIPIIMVSVQTDRGARLAALNAGAEEFLAKPVDQAELWLRVRNLLRLKALSDFLQNHSSNLEQQVQARTESLHVSESRFRQMADNIREVFFLVDVESNRMLYVSPAYEEIWGRSCEYLYANPESWTEAFHPDDRASTHEKYKQGMVAGNFELEYRIVRPDGSIRWIDTKGFAVRDDAGKMVRIAGVAKDITQHKRAEQLLRLEHMVASSLANADSGSTALQAVIRAICEAQSWECGRYLQVDEQAGVLRFSQSWHAPDGAIEQFVEDKRKAVFGPGVGLAGRAWQSGQPTWIADINTDARALRAATTLETGMRGAFHFPVISENKTIGVLAFNSLKVREPDERMLQAVRMIGGQIGQFMTRMAQQEHIARLNRIYAVLSGINALIVRVRNRQELFNEACRIAVEQGNFGIAWIGRFDPVTLDITPVAWAGLHAELLTQDKSTADSSLPRGQGGIGRAIRERKPMFENDMTIVPERGGKRRKEAIRLGYRSLIVLPLIVEGAPVGSMSLFAKEPNFFTEDELKLLTELAGDISFALEHIGKAEKIARLSRIQAVMSNTNSMIVRVRDRQELYNETCRIAVEHGGFEIAWIAVPNPETLDLTPVAWSGFEAKSLASTPGTGNSLVDQAFKEKRAMFRNDIPSETTEGGARRQEAIRRGYRSFIALPLLVEGIAAANISLYSKEPNFFNEEELTLLNQLASDISFALEHIAKEEKIARLVRIHAVLSGINSLIVRVRDRQELLDGTCKIAAEKGNFGIAWIGLLNADTSVITPVAWAGRDSEHLDPSTATIRADLPEGQGMVGRAMREKRALFTNDLAAEPNVGGERRKKAIRLGYRSLIALPLIVQGAAVGNLALFAKEPNFFNQDEIKLLSELAGNISFALENIAKEEQLQYLSYYDNLTGLPNRTLFLDRLNQQLHARSSEPRMVALILLDLERFRIVNETLGRNGGDELLRQVAQRLEHACEGKENLARVSANAYGVVIRGVRDAADIAQAVESRLLTCFREPYTVNGTELRLAVKAGIALFPTDGSDTDTLFRNAEAALKKAKTFGDRYLFYAAEMNERAAQALSLETRMRKAVEAQQFTLHYQPKVELATGLICGLEALIRWNDPENGLIPPGHFIPLLEETGLIIEVGQWALERALADYRDWLKRGYDAPRIAVNVSSIQLRQRNFVDTVSKVIGDKRTMPQGLDIEITESLLMEDIQGNIVKLKALREMGINISIDDFGTGYSSLGYLARLPVNALKIDRSFIVAMSNDAESMAIISTIISLGHSLNMKIIAEGVETEEQSRFLKLLKCDQMQGYLFSKPLPREIFEARYLA